MKFDVWALEVDRLCLAETGISAQLLGEVYPWEIAFEDGLDPEEAVEDLFDTSELARAIRHDYKFNLNK